MYTLTTVLHPCLAAVAEGVIENDKHVEIFVFNVADGVCDSLIVITYVQMV